MTNQKVLVTENFINYSLTLAEDILGYNECFGGDKDIKKELRKHIKKCKDLLNK